MYSKKLRTTGRNLQRHTQHMIILKPILVSSKTYIPLTELKLEPVCGITTPETPVRAILQCLWDLQRHTKIPVTKAKTKLPAKSLMSCDRLVVCIRCRYYSNRPELVFNLCEERTPIPTVIITYELTRNPDVCIILPPGIKSLLMLQTKRFIRAKRVSNCYMQEKKN